MSRNINSPHGLQIIHHPDALAFLFEQNTWFHWVPLNGIAFVAGVGTGGTVMGVGRCLRAQNPAVRIHPVEPAESPTLSTGRKNGRHRIQGISDEFIPPVVRLAELDAIVPVHDGDAILMAQMLARDLGLGVGISSGANMAAALAVQDHLADDPIVVTVFPDSNKKYLSTGLLCEEPMQAGYVSHDTELLGFSALPRVCSACVDFQPGTAGTTARQTLTVT
jgi:cysteine synthase A